MADGVVYFTDFGGYLNAVNAQTGRLIWQRQIASYDGQPGLAAHLGRRLHGAERLLRLSVALNLRTGQHRVGTQGRGLGRVERRVRSRLCAGGDLVPVARQP